MHALLSLLHAQCVHVYAFFFSEYHLLHSLLSAVLLTAAEMHGVHECCFIKAYMVHVKNFPNLLTSMQEKSCEANLLKENVNLMSVHCMAYNRSLNWLPKPIFLMIQGETSDLLVLKQQSTSSVKKYTEKESHSCQP